MLEPLLGDPLAEPGAARQQDLSFELSKSVHASIPEDRFGLFAAAPRHVRRRSHRLLRKLVNSHAAGLLCLAARKALARATGSVGSAAFFLVFVVDFGRAGELAVA